MTLQSETSIFHSEIINETCLSKDIDGLFRVGAFSKAIELHVFGKAILSDFCNFKRCILNKFFACGNFCTATDTHFGSFVSVGERVTFNGGNHPKGNLTTHLFKYNPKVWELDSDLTCDNYEWRKNLTIGNDVWVGSNSIILTGLSIGDGAIIGANSLVNKDVPPYAICVGSPGKVIGYRFQPEIIRRLIAVAWWKLPVDRLMKLPINDIEGCLSILEKS